MCPARPPGPAERAPVPGRTAAAANGAGANGAGAKTGARAAALRPWAHLALALAAAAAGGPVAAAVPEPEGFRGPPYNAPVPLTLAGATVIDAPEALRLHAAGAPFIDVYPQIQRPDALPAGTLWRQPPHDSIPGALWLPGTGFERLSPAETALLEAGLATASRGDRAKVMVIFCRADCWLSWNAAKRGVAMGYSSIRWFREGIEGWQAAGGSLQPAAPPPGSPAAP